jgi:hypothetical protein
METRVVVASFVVPEKVDRYHHNTLLVGLHLLVKILTSLASWKERYSDAFFGVSVSAGAGAGVRPATGWLEPINQNPSSQLQLSLQFAVFWVHRANARSQVPVQSAGLNRRLRFLLSVSLFFVLGRGFFAGTGSKLA